MRNQLLRKSETGLRDYYPSWAEEVGDWRKIDRLIGLMPTEDFAIFNSRLRSFCLILTSYAAILLGLFLTMFDCVLG